LSAFKKTFKQTESVKSLKNNRINSKQNRVKTKRQKINKTYIHNVLLKRYVKKALSIKSNPNLLHGSALPALLSRQSRQALLIKRDLFRSLKKRNLVRFLKKREMKKGFKRINLMELSGLNGGQKNKTLAFKNYFGKKVSRKVLLKLRNKHNIFKIRLKMKKLNKSRFGKIRLPYSNLKFKNEIKFFSFKLVSELKYIRKLFFFNFIKYILSLFQIKIKISQAKKIFLPANQNPQVLARLANNSQLCYELTVDETQSSGWPMRSKKKNIKTIKAKRTSFVKTQSAKKKNIKLIKRYSYDKLRNIDLLNLEVLNFLRLTLAEGSVNGHA